MMRLAIVFLAACGLNYTPDVGALQPTEPDAGFETDAGLTSIGTCDDSDPSTTVSFSTQIRPLTSKDLATLHSSWSRRLRVGDDRPAWRVTFTRPPSETVG